MKKKWMIFLALFFILCGFIIIFIGKAYQDNTASFNNIKRAINHLLASFKSQNKSDEQSNPPKSEDTLLLLLSEKHNDPILVKGWKQVALEEGLHLSTLPDSNFLDENATHYRGIILSDSIHQDISPELSKKLIRYVSSGGALMLVFDAATLNEANDPLKRFPLLSEMLGINCGEPNLLKGCISQIGPIGNNKTALSALGVPPGKCITSNNSDDISALSNDFCAISSAEYGVLNYLHYVISSSSKESYLLTTPDNQLIATIKSFGKGQVLYINLPITHLWFQTDSLFMHLFLHYFAVDMLNLPTLATVPNGIGGLVLNLHVESIDALAAFDLLKKIGFFQQKPYSIDFTAGPGLDTLDDHLGLNVAGNKKTQEWMHYLKNLGNAIGSDGGWAHNYFCAFTNDNTSGFTKYIKLNNEAIEAILKQKVLEYVPSCGNQPLWATNYLEQQGFLGYYSTANTGVGPTKNFRNGRMDKGSLWSFPVLPFQTGASIRDFGRIGYSPESVTQWLKESAHFVSSTHSSRLIYFHPPDILMFPQFVNSLKLWLETTKKLQNNDSFRWYSMVGLSQFLNERQKVTWTVKYTKDLQVFAVSHPNSLNAQSIIISKNQCERPQFTKGDGLIKEDADHWIVQAGLVKYLEFTCKLIKSNDYS